MTDSIALQRTANGSLTSNQAKQIKLALASNKIDAKLKPTLLKWLSSEAIVTAGSTIEKILIKANTIHPVLVLDSNTKPVYYGTSPLRYLMPDQVLKLSGNLLSTSLVNTTIFNCAGGKYPYYAYPASFGLPTMPTLVTEAGTLQFNDYTLSTLTITDSNKNPVIYNVLRFNNLETGKDITINWL